MALTDRNSKGRATDLVIHYAAFNYGEPGQKGMCGRRAQCGSKEWKEVNCIRCLQRSGIPEQHARAERERNPAPEETPKFEVPSDMAHAYRDGRFRPSEY